MNVTRPLLSRRKPRVSRETVADAHERLDALEDTVDNLSVAIQNSTDGYEKLARTVADLSKAVDGLQAATKSTSDSIKDVVTNTAAGREILAKMLEEVVTKKTGSWAMWAVGAAIVSLPNWIPQLQRVLGHG